MRLFFSPLQATNEVISRVPKATQEEMLAAVDSCSRAFHSWSETSILARQQIFLRYQQLIKDNIVSQRYRTYKEQLKNSFLLLHFSSFNNIFTITQNLLFLFDSKMVFQVLINLKLKTMD